MHYPADATCLPFPVYFTQWAVANFIATEDELRAVFGAPHFEGGLEDNWAWQLADGTCLRVGLEVPYDWVIVYCDPPNADRAITALGLSSQCNALKVLPEPVQFGRPAGDA